MVRNLIPFHGENVSSQRIRKILSLALIVGLLQTFSLTYLLVQAPPAHATLPTTFNPVDSGTLTIPSNDITALEVDMEGGGAGTGGYAGTTATTNTQPGGRGKLNLLVQVYSGMVIGFYPGNAGSNGANNATNSGGGAGGTSTYRSEFNGGKGGDAGSASTSGGGGGGGAASILTLNGSIVAVASGAGGGGGNPNDSSSWSQSGKDDDSAVNTSNTGGDGLKTTPTNSASNKTPYCTEATTWGGGGGGGGGGYAPTNNNYGGGAGGQLLPAGPVKCAGDGGNRGKNFTDVITTNLYSETVQTTNKTSNGIIRVKYRLGILNTSAIATPNSMGSITASWQANPYASGYRIQIYASNDYSNSNALATKDVAVGTTSTTITSVDFSAIAHSTSYRVGFTALGDSTTFVSSNGLTTASVTTNSPAGANSTIDSALNLSGSDSQIAFTASSALNQIPDTFTAEAWIYPTSYACTGGNASPWNSNDSYCHVMAKGNHFGLLLKSSSTAGSAGESSGQLGFIWSGTVKYSKFIVPLNEWHHIAFSREGSGGSASKLYVDGNLIYEDTTTANSANTTRDFSIGASRSDGTSTNDIFGKFIGQIDEVKLSTRFRTQAEIRDDLRLHNNENSVFRLYYDFNENSGTTAYNRIIGSGVSTDLTIKNANYSSSSIYNTDTTTISAYTIVTFFRTFIVAANGWTSPSDRRTIRYLVVGGGGGGGGGYNGGGGGAGGYRESNRSLESNTVYSIEVGPGGNGALGKYAPTNGTASAIRNYLTPTDSITASGGGRGATEQQAVNGPNSQSSPDGSPYSGGSGGGGSHGATSNLNGASGNVGGFNPVEGYAGGSGSSSGGVNSGEGYFAGGGGGGAGGVGGSATSSGTGVPGNGGVGVTTTITGSSLQIAGGGAGAGRFVTSNVVSVNSGISSHGGGSGTCQTNCSTFDTGTAGVANTGGGGGAGAFTSGNASGGFGGSGFVVIRYITDKPVILTQPVSDTLTVGAVETFTVSTNSPPSPLQKSVQWQFTADTTTAIVANITGWTNVSTGSGFTTDTFTTAALTLSMNKYRYRVIISFSDTSTLSITETSTVVTLTINNTLIITVDSSTITRKYGAAQMVRTITYTGGTAPFRVTTPNRPLANGKIYVDTTTSIAYFKVDTGTTVGTYTETVTVTDNFGISASYTQRIVVNPADTLTVQADTLTAITYNPNGMTINPTVTITGLVASDTKSAVTISFSAPGSTCANGGTCTVGDIGPAGGVVFYVSNTGTINVASGISDGGIYLEAAPGPFSTTTYNWCEGSSNPYTTLIGGTSSDIGTGASNTALALASCTGGAIYQAANLTIGGKSDWFLPSSNELSQMYANRVAIGLVSNALYWGSTENGNWIAASLVMSNGGIGSQNKGQATPYWPIRAFSSSGSVQPALASTTTAPNSAGTYTLTPSALSLANGVSTSNYVNVIYRTSQFTINKASQSTLVITSKVAPFNGNPSPLKLITTGGTDTGTVTYAIVSGGSAGACQMSSDVLSVTSTGTCKVVATKAATINYLVAYSDTVTITFESFVSHQPIQTQSVPTQLPINGKNALDTTTATTPVVTSVTNTGAGAYNISGSGFTGASRVSIGGTNVSFTNSNDSTISITGASGYFGPLMIECTDGRIGPVPFYIFLP